MTLTTHAVVGAAVASLVPNHPVIGFVGGFVSHFIIDAIPHWAEGKFFIRSVEKVPNKPASRSIHFDKNLVHDVAVIGLDSLIGFSISILILWYFFHVPLYIVVLGAFAGQMPDGLQFLYFIFKPRFMTPLQKFHEMIQTEYDNLAYLGIEAGLILIVVVLGMLGAFMLQ